jgi:site-specific DNA-methyltransferase (adenine-specific)
MYSSDYKDDSLWLMKGDCLERMKEIPDGSVDLVLTDPPYGTSACKWDSTIPLDEMWRHLVRIIKPEGAIVLFGSQPFTSLLISSNLKMFKYQLIWEKDRAANFLNMKYQFGKSHEEVLVFGKMATSYSKKGNMKFFPQMEEGEPYVCKRGSASETTTRDAKTRDNLVTTVNTGGRYPKSILRFNSERGLHPTQKPVPLVEYLMKSYTLQGDSVLDFTAGSFTTGVAAVRLDRKFIGIELDEGYFELGKQRVLDELAAMENLND